MNPTKEAMKGGLPPQPLLQRLSSKRRTLIPLGILIGMIIALQVVSPSGINYFTISTISTSTAALAFAAIGETIVVLVGGLDLSVGAVISLVNVVLVTQLGASTISPVAYVALSFVLSLGLGAAIGAINGVLVAYGRLQSIIVTLAMMFAAQGAALLILKTPGGQFSYSVSTLLIGDAIPNILPSSLIVIAIAIAIWLYLKSTRLGTAFYAIGSDEGAASSNGVTAPATRFWAFTLTGMFYGAAGLFVTANIGAGDPLIGQPMLLKVFAAVVLGGTIIGGGKGGAVGSVIGAFILSVLVEIFLLLGISTYYVSIVEGVILLLAVLGFSRISDLPIWGALGALRKQLQRTAAVSTLHGFAAAETTIHRTASPGWFERNSRMLRRILPAWVLTALAIAVTAVIAGAGFSLPGHLVSLLIFGSFLAIISLGQGAVIMSGGLDLSVAWTITFPAILLTSTANGSDAIAIWAIPLALLVGTLVGLLNGILTAGFSFSPIIATLATGSILQGVALVFSGGAPNGAAPPSVVWFVNGRFAGLPPVVWFLFIFVVVATLVFDQSSFARRLRAVGQDEWIAHLSGVRTKIVTIVAYVLSGFCAALVGILLAGFTAQAYYYMGNPYLLASIAAVVVGGTSITGGRGNYLGILGGALLFTELTSMLATTSLPEAVRNIIYGFVLLGAVSMLRERQIR
jgi:ribose transport system permease protein